MVGAFERILTEIQQLGEAQGDKRFLPDGKAVRSLLAQSPIGTDVFKGNLDRVAIEGDGSFELGMTVPIRDWQSFEFTSRVETNAATLQMEGFPAPLTELDGVITIGRDDVSSEELHGTFLGKPINIDLQPAPESMPVMPAS